MGPQRSVAGLEQGIGAPGRGLGATVRHLGTDDRSSQRVRIVDGALRCVARRGTRRATVDEIAREAGLSRATVYRTFPGGKEAILLAAVDTEVARLFSALAVVMGDAADLRGVLVDGTCTAARRISSHPALRRVLDDEPGVLLPHVAFAGMDGVLAAASTFAAPFFARWLEPEDAARAAEWAVRILVSYLLYPADGLDLTDRSDTERLMDRFVLPGIAALRAAHRPPPGPAPGRHRRAAAGR